MARTKKQIKAKEPVRIRFKQLANGNKSIYLDIYKDGKRTYEFLKLYIVPEVDEASRTQNANTMQAANAIKSQRIISLANGSAGIINKSHQANMLLTDWIDFCVKQKETPGRSTSFADQIRKMNTHIKLYNGKVTLKQVDADYCRGFVLYLKGARKANDKKKGKKASGKVLSASTVFTYAAALNCALEMAVRKDIIPRNPFQRLESDEKPTRPESEREYLTVDEVKKMIDTPCFHETVRRAFLFSCFCGLRKSDIERLTWANIQTDGGKAVLRIVVKKTSRPLTLPLSKMALRWLPARGKAKDTDRVFPLPAYSDFCSKIIKPWAAEAGIKKCVTFHVARHTFATMELTAGADIYTTSKLLGHCDVRTTQIYAKIIDQKKAEAVDMVSSLFNE